MTARYVSYICIALITCASAVHAQTSATPPPAPSPQWLSVRGEFRERMEGVSASGFTEGRDDLYWLSRARLTASIVPSPRWSFSVQVQDARVGRKEIGATRTPFSAPFDLRAAYADLSPSPRVSFRLGRQELAFGEQRLVGHANWLNAARTFDAARVTWRTGPAQVDAFAASVVRIQHGAFDRSGHGNRFAGVVAAMPTVVPKASLEPFLYWRADRGLVDEAGGTGTLSQHTAGVRWTGSLPARFAYSLEMAWQRGSLGADSVGAWAGHWRARHTISGRLGLQLVGEVNYASGDRDPFDGERGTFDQLYATAHDKYGLADQIGWRNIQHVRAGVEFLPVAKTPVAVNYHSWWLAEPTDALYSAGGAVVARVAGGARHRHVGHELDVQASRNVTPQLQIAAGYAYLFPGAFLKEATPGHGLGAPYVMATLILSQ